MKKMITNLPSDMLEEIISRVPLKYTREVRLTCKKWNVLSKTRILTRMHKAKELGESRMIVLLDYKLYLMSIFVNENPSTKSLGKLTCLKDSEPIKISQVFHCDGLLLCILKDDINNVVVWNPYLGEKRWIKTRDCYLVRKGNYKYMYALGYDNSRQCHKILRFIANITLQRRYVYEFEIYHIDSDLWTTLDINPHWDIYDCHDGVSLKGNTYWCAKEKDKHGPIDHIICFNFTEERFGPLLPLPFQAWVGQFAGLSCVKDDKLAALIRTSEKCKVEIWITTKIEAEKVLWSKFLTVDLRSCLDHMISEKSFFVDEEKKVAVVYGKEVKAIVYPTHDTITFIGEAGYLRKFALGELVAKRCRPLVCSYVPSLAQIKQPSRGKRKITQIFF